MLLTNEFLRLLLLLLMLSNFKVIRTVSAANSHLRSSLPQLQKTSEIIAQVFLKRKKRFLIFEKGAAVIFQGNIGKAILPGRPRGLNEIAEYTLTYDLPWQVDFHKVSKTTRKPKIVSTTTTTAPKWHYNNLNYEKKGQLTSNRWCPKQRIFQKYYEKQAKDEFAWCALKRRVKRLKTQPNAEETNIDAGEGHSMLLFDLISHLAKMHDFNPRHCIKRALCESKHFLLPPGQLLFHDLVRILLRWVGEGGAEGV